MRSSARYNFPVSDDVGDLKVDQRSRSPSPTYTHMETVPPSPAPKHSAHAALQKRTSRNIPARVFCQSNGYYVQVYIYMSPCVPMCGSI